MFLKSYHSIWMYRQYLLGFTQKKKSRWQNSYYLRNWKQSTVLVICLQSLKLYLFCRIAIFVAESPVNIETLMDHGWKRAKTQMAIPDITNSIICRSMGESHRSPKKTHCKSFCLFSQWSGSHLQDIVFWWSLKYVPPTFWPVPFIFHLKNVTRDGLQGLNLLTRDGSSGTRQIMQSIGNLSIL